MAFKQRMELNVRIAGEKGQKSDEMIVRSQLQPGRNITFEYKDNWDIHIHALDGGASAATLPRMIEGIITLHIEPVTADSIATNIDELMDAGSYSYGYGEPVFNDIQHNWNLTDKDAFLLTLMRQHDYSSGVALRWVPDSFIRFVGLDENTVRLWGTKLDPSVFDILDWRPNTDTILKQGGGLRTEWTTYPLKIHFTLMEKVPLQGEL